MIPESASVVLAVDRSRSTPKNETETPTRTLRLPPKCPICGAREKWNPEARRYENPEHDYEAHNLGRPKPRQEAASQ